jgi:hypothetical protein
MNVTYNHNNDLIMFLQYSHIEVSLAFMLPTISPFGIDGNIDEKHLVPRIPTIKDCYPFFSNPLHQSFSPIDITQCSLYQTIFHYVISPFNVLYIKKKSCCNLSPIDINVKGFNNYLSLKQLSLTFSSVQRHY